MAASACLNYGIQAIGGPLWDQTSKRCIIRNMFTGNRNLKKTTLPRGMKMMESGLGSSCPSQSARGVRCSVGIGDFIGGDLLKLDLGQWLSDVEEHKALAIYTPHEGGYEGRYFTRLRYQVMRESKIFIWSICGSVRDSISQQMSRCYGTLFFWLNLCRHSLGFVVCYIFPGLLFSWPYCPRTWWSWDDPLESPPCLPCEFLISLYLQWPVGMLYHNPRIEL